MLGVVVNSSEKPIESSKVPACRLRILSALVWCKSILPPASSIIKGVASCYQKCGCGVSLPFTHPCTWPLKHCCVYWLTKIGSWLTLSCWNVSVLIPSDIMPSHSLAVASSPSILLLCGSLFIKYIALYIFSCGAVGGKSAVNLSLVGGKYVCMFVSVCRSGGRSVGEWVSEWMGSTRLASVEDLECHSIKITKSTECFGR